MRVYSVIYLNKTHSRNTAYLATPFCQITLHAHRCAHRQEPDFQRLFPESVDAELAVGAQIVVEEVQIEHMVDAGAQHAAVVFSGFGGFND